MTPDSVPVDPWPSAPIGAHQIHVDDGYGLTGAVGEVQTRSEQDPPTGPAKPAPRNRRGPLILLGAGALVLLAVAAAVGWRLVAARAEVDFQQLDEAKSIDTGDTLADSYNTLTAIDGERAYMAWLSDSDGSWSIRLTAGDLSTGEDARRATLGPANRLVSITALADVLLVLTEKDSPRVRTLYAVDPTTLALRWQRPLTSDESFVSYDDYLVTMDTEQGILHRVGLADNADGWTKQFADATFMVERTRPDYTGPGWLSGEPIIATDTRRLVVLDQGTLRVIDPASGAEQVTLAGVNAGSESTVYDGNFYTSQPISAGGYQIDVYKLANGSLPRAIYAVADPDLAVSGLLPCGPGICVVQRTTKNYDLTVLAMPTSGAQPRWTFTGKNLDSFAPLGEGMLVGASTDAHTWIINKAGKVVYDRTDRVGVRVAPGSVLIWSEFSSSASTVGLEGFTVSSAESTALGTADAVRPTGCSWSRAVLACPSGQRLVWWRFAG